MTLKYAYLHVDMIICSRIDEQDEIHDMLFDQGNRLSTGRSQ